MAIERHIEKLQKEAAGARAELGRIARLRREFPDLETDTDRWGHIRYMARSANSRVDQVLFHRNCGCCADTPLHARPYLEFEGFKIYSNPCNVMVGSHSEWGDGFKENDHWRAAYEEAGVNPAVIESIRRHIEYLAHDDEDENEDEEWD